MQIKVTDVVYPDNFERGSFRFTVPKADLVDSSMTAAREQGKEQDAIALAGLLPSLTRWLGHYGGTSLFALLLDSICQEEHDVGEKGINDQLATELLAAFGTPVSSLSARRPGP